ncbi:hypothetical protein H4S00_005316 [Coemansia sp. D1744]|nr:hypothetical protein H4S00_005316 [Coemansia sp. D1744]
MFRPCTPFFRKSAHKHHVLCEYRKLLRQTKQFDPVEQTYLWSWIRERFHHNKRQTSPTQASQYLSNGTWASLVMSAALNGSTTQRQYISDLAYGRTGYLKDVAQQVREFHHPTKPCQTIRDVRPRSSRIHQPHKAYWIPLDLRVFSVPQHLLDRIRDEDERDRLRERRKRQRRELRLAREISELTNAVNEGNHAVRDSGLLPEAFTSVPAVAKSPFHIPGVAGNPLWIPPRIKLHLDPPFVQHVRASSGFELYKVNGRKPPHWLAAKVAASYRKLSHRLHLHEFYYYFAQDLKLEEEFEARLGVYDPGYWIYASNYREYLRNKIKESSGNGSVDVGSCEMGAEEWNSRAMLQRAMQEFAND